MRISRPSTRRSAVPPDLAHPDCPTLCAPLNAHNVDYLVIGGWAAIAHGLPRTTIDVDLVIRPTPANAAKLIEALCKIGFGIAKELTPQEILSRKAFLFADQIRIDIFTEPWGLTDFDACHSRRRDIEFESVRIPFVGLQDLILTKETGREQDIEDLKALRELERYRKGGAGHP